MYVRWKRRRLKRLPEPVYSPEFDALSHNRHGRHGTLYVRNIGWRQHVRSQGIDPDSVLMQPAREDYALDAVLVESRRVDGQPRQRHVGHLASIREHELIAGWPYALDRFWAAVERRLIALAVPEGDRDRVRDTLAKRVPRVTAAL